MHRDSYIESLRSELLDLVEEHLSPIALRYGYSEVPLESNIKWRPLVLVLGNYSSGKSTLINDFLGMKIQATGQAPTDDSFTVITYGEPDHDPETVQVVETRDGKFLLNDPEYPFETLKRYGQRFAAHFRLKKVNSPFLENLAIIDTPGMLDSITERDRGYDYQEVIGDLAQMADLVLVLFDPHKAGTVRETHTSLRDTLPAKTFEDRVLFVLNRIDECASLIDLLQVYGTLCWNLSQMTGRKDIPPIRLTYSAHAMATPPGELGQDLDYLRYLANQRTELKEAVLQAPRYRLDNLATFVETHGERLSHLLEALVS
jgi:EH domain-containing protein 1